MIQIYFNDEKLLLEKNITLAGLLKQHGYEHQTFAVAVNRQFIPKGHYTAVTLNHDDHIEIILPMQGG